VSERIDGAGLFEVGAQLRDHGGDAVWAEGPVWVPRLRAVRFSDIPNNRILQWTQADDRIRVYAENAEFTNGRTLGLAGQVIQCSHGRRRVEVDRDGELAALVDRWDGRRFNSPNDVVVKSDGSVWFTDPSYGIKKPDEGHPGELEYDDHWVFRFDPATGTVQPVVIDVEMPNGLAFSPDESLLYVSDTAIDPPSGEPNPLGAHCIHVYDVQGGHRCKNGRIFKEVEPGVPDGFRVDEHGNVWTSALDGVHVYSPSGRRIGFLPTPAKVGNLCFGGDDGRTMFVLATTSLHSIRTTVRDAAHVIRSH
jgi:gluconolactonase